MSARELVDRMVKAGLRPGADHGWGWDETACRDLVMPAWDTWRDLIMSDDGMPSVDAGWVRSTAELMAVSVPVRDTFLMTAIAPNEVTPDVARTLMGEPRSPVATKSTARILDDAFRDSEPPSFRRFDLAADLLTGVADAAAHVEGFLAAAPLAAAAYLKWWEGDAAPASRLCDRALDADEHAGLAPITRTMVDHDCYPAHVAAHPTALARYRVDEWTSGRAGRPEGRWALDHAPVNDRDGVELRFGTGPEDPDFNNAVFAAATEAAATDPYAADAERVNRAAFRDAEDRLLEWAGLDVADIDHWRTFDGQWLGPKYGRQVPWRDDLPTPEDDHAAMPDLLADPPAQMRAR